ncbi:hypothetical protein H9649_07550 [Sporosarcina sp. Sa2YVA2]|uniref:Uncharacterized protein n=1 Tax=Sporosarcina quadrami TaxID=2762234 RepID=A0ABR8U8R8_9BACL|nr:hypothetical protein [Sporosarcina quadrami]MBD7984429.1 hypothetical protein [Sporosarcina quadrami]
MFKDAIDQMEDGNYIDKLREENARLREALKEILRNQCRHLCSTQARQALAVDPDD